MKILIAYFSQTGNTAHIAQTIYDEVSQREESEISKIEELDADNLADYGLIFIGSPIHAGGLASQVKEFLDRIPRGAKLKLAPFATHASFLYEKANYEKGIAYFEELSKEKGLICFSPFSCQGRLTPSLHEMVKKMRKLSDEEWAERMQEVEKHPDKEDESKARAFARQVLEKM